MNLTHRTRRITTLATITAAALAGGVTGGIALADTRATRADQRANTSFVGGGVVSHRVATSDGIFDTTATNTWQTVPGSTIAYNVPRGSIRLVTAEFTAEAHGRDGTGGCSARIVTRLAGSTTLTELYPRSGVDFMWTQEEALSRAHAMARSIRVGSGTRYYTVQIQASTVDTLRCRVDDWHFQINAHTAS